MEKTHNNERDKISDLPDAILHHIFSFLNMEEAVRSSVLSKRWRNLWTSLPILNFEYQVISSDNKVERIKGLVDKVFILRDGSNIQRFSFICCSKKLHSSAVNTWVTSALRCNVQELVIEISFGAWLWLYPIAACTLFNSTSLTFLRWVCSPLNDCLFLHLPDSVWLPSLKTLFLQNLDFGFDSDGINQLVSSCPVLESLTIKEARFFRNTKISSLSLKHLVFEDALEIYENNGCLLQSILKLITPNLTSFRCKDYLSKKYYLEDISSLIKADICMCQSIVKYGDDDYDKYMLLEAKMQWRAQYMLKFLRAFHNVKDLTLSAAILEVISGSPDLLEAEPIELCVLSILRLKTFLSHDTIPAIAYLLNISPEIKSLFVEISQLIKYGSSDIGEYPEAEASSQCLWDNLELVEIRDAVGCVNELYFIKLLLKNAKVLKKMVVYTSKKDAPEREECLLKFNEELLTFPKASSNITIMFI